MQPRADSKIHIEFERCRDVEQNLMIVYFRSNTWLYVRINMCSILELIFVMINTWNKEKITALGAKSLMEKSTIFECLFRKRVLGIWAWNRQNSHCNTLQHTATYCNIRQHTAAHCNTLHHEQYGHEANETTLCNTLHYTATHCNTLQHTTPRAIWARSELHVTACELLHSHCICCFMRGTTCLVLYSLFYGIQYNSLLYPHEKLLGIQRVSNPSTENQWISTPAHSNGGTSERTLVRS